MPWIDGLRRTLHRSLIAPASIHAGAAISRLGRIGPLGSATLLLGGLALWVPAAVSVRPDWAPAWSGWVLSFVSIVASVAGSSGLPYQSSVVESRPCELTAA